MLIALFTLLFLGGNPHPLIPYLNVYQDRVAIVITDEVRRNQALAVLKAFEESTNDRNEEMLETAEQLGDAMGDRDSMAAEIDVIWNQYFEDANAFHGLIIDSRFELKQYVNRDEWQAIFGQPATKE